MRTTSKGVLWYRVTADGRINNVFRIQWTTPDTKHYTTCRMNGQCLDIFTRELKLLGYSEVV